LGQSWLATNVIGGGVTKNYYVTGENSHWADNRIYFNLIHDRRFDLLYFDSCFEIVN